MDELKQSLNPEQRLAARRAFLRAIAISGSQVRLAAKIGVTQQALSKWLQRDGLAQGRFVEAIETVTGVSRHELRPDIYPVETPSRFHAVDTRLPTVSFQNGHILQRTNEAGEAA